MIDALTFYPVVVIGAALSLALAVGYLIYRAIEWLRRTWS